MQEISSKKSIVVVNSSDVHPEELEKQGAAKVGVKYLIDERHGSNYFALRLYTVEKGGNTPLDEHLHEHQVYVLSGRGLLRQSKDAHVSQRALKPGDSVFIPSNAVHQFINEFDEPFVFLCVKGNPGLYERGKPITTADDSKRNYC
jgi:quercetin dioxygenase-like cupin family protein